MKSNVTNILNILQEDVNFISNDFSNEYNFNEEKATEFFEDFITNSENAPIFSGIIILQKQAINYSIVDGLKRLTTINLLLLALCDYFKSTSDKNNESEEKIRYRFLIKDNKPKLKLNNNDEVTFERLVLAKKTDGNDECSPLYLEYVTFMRLIEEKKVNPNRLFKLISQIQYMIIITKESEIPTRDLYQSLNTVNQESQINLITDFVNQQGTPAKKTWQTIIDLFDSTPNKLESFLKDFLVARLEEEIINKEDVYRNFKKYFYKLSKYQKSREIIETIHKYSIYYLKIVNEDFKTPEVKHQINILNKNSGKDTYPYLMEVLDDLENGHINENVFLNLLMMINLFIKSRDEFSMGNISIDFSKLSKELNKMLVLKDYVPEIISENKLTINEINNLSNFEV